MPFHRRLLALTDDQLARLMAAAAPLQLLDRPAFLETVAARVQALSEIGPGALHCLLREAQAEFLRAPALDGTGSAPPAGFVSRRRRAGRRGTAARAARGKREPVDKSHPGWQNFLDMR